MLMYDPGGNFTLTLQPFSPLTANRVFTFPDESGTLLVSPTPMTNGQLLIGWTGHNPNQTTLTAGNGITITNGAGTITIASNVGFGSGGFGESTPGDPAPVAPAAAPIMMGLAGTVNIVHNNSHMMIIISGYIQDSKNNSGAVMQIYYGPGAVAPAYGDAPGGHGGVAVVPTLTFFETNKNFIVPIDLNGIPAAALASGTYWIDIALKANTAGSTAALHNITISATEF